MTSFSLYGSDGKTSIRDLSDWLKYGAPAKESHWKKGRSAYETAYSWLPENKPGVPLEFYEMLRGTELADLKFISAVVEHKTTFGDTTKGPRNHDLLIKANFRSTRVIIGLEGKEREPFDKTIVQKIKSSPNSKLPARVDSFCKGIFGQNYCWKFNNIHYQLLSGIAGVAVEVQKNKAGFGMFVVQQIRTNKTPKSNIDYNNICYNEFIQLMGYTKRTNNTLIGPITLEGSDLVPSVKVYISKFNTYRKL